jgi:hypothetical protein
MTTSWDELANSPRWRGVVSFVRHWVGPLGLAQGMAPAELDAILSTKRLVLPAAVREWYLLAAHWSQGALNVWIRPRELAELEGVILFLTDTEGIQEWSVRVADQGIEDPPVVARDGSPGGEVVCATFSSFVAAMIMNDVIFDYETDPPVELDPASARSGLTCLVSGSLGRFFADALLESATVVMFDYGGNDGPVLGKSRTPEGRALLDRWRRETA